MTKNYLCFFSDPEVNEVKAGEMVTSTDMTVITERNHCDQILLRCSRVLQQRDGPPWAVTPF